MAAQAAQAPTHILLFGSHGMLGSALKAYFTSHARYRVDCPTRSVYTITVDSLSELDTVFQRYQVTSETYVINAAGMIPQRKPATSAEYYTVNTLFPLQLARLCTVYGAKLIHPTTDCVFTGEGHPPPTGYDEDAVHDERSAYGLSKSLGEPTSTAMVLRTSILGEEPNATAASTAGGPVSFLEFVRQSHGIIPGWADHYWNGITCIQYAKIMDEIIQSSLWRTGVYHLYSPEVVTKYEMAVMIREIYHVDVTILRTETGKPTRKVLTTARSLLSDLSPIPSLEIQLEEQRDFWGAEQAS